MSPTAVQRELAVCRSVTVVHGWGENAVIALAGIDLTIGRGERIGLVGRSGSGKTTLLHVLGGLVEPAYGAVLLGGEPLASLDAAARGRARARSVAYVFQGANLLPTFTAFENVAFADRVSRLACAGDAATDGDGGGCERIRPAELLALVGLADKFDALPAELSGGEAQRVAIARALAGGPQMLLCDEPTGQLDSDTAARVQDLIAALHARMQFALVIATHDPDVAARADRIVTLDDGRIASDQELD